MKKYVVGVLLLVPVMATSAQAAPADEWVDNYANEEAQDWYEFSQSQNSQSASGDASDEDQTAAVNNSQRGPVFVEESNSNDTNEIGGSGISLLPIVGNDILGDVDALNNVLNNYSQTNNSDNPITQIRSEDNDTDHTAIVDDSFNAGKVPTVVFRPARTVVGGGGAASGKLPITGQNFLSPLALGIWLIVAGAWMIRRGSNAILNPQLSR